MYLDKFFKAKSVAIIGVSKDENKVGHVLFKNLLESGYKGKIFIINPNETEILGHICYPSVLSIKEKIDLAVIAIPANIILNVVDECGRKGIKNLVIVTSGFEEVGNFELRDKLKKLLDQYDIKAIGPNCLGIYDANAKIDLIFLPKSRMKRPEKGNISLVCQSGAVGGALIELGAKKNYKFAKFISYGNAINIDESDILEYLGKDKETKIICMYIEGIKDGKKFLEIAKKVSKKKPIIVVKGGVTEEGSKAALSHTGSLAGSAVVYSGAFKQANVIEADGLEELFEFAKIFSVVKPKGNRVQVITNGGGYGILCTDAIIKNNLKMAAMDEKRKTQLKKQFPDIVVLKNPLDLTGVATTKWYESAISECIKDDNIDIILVVTLFQTPLITEEIVNSLSKLNKMRKKPIIVVSTGAEFTEKLNKKIKDAGIPVYEFPEMAVKSIKKLIEYYS